MENQVLIKSRIYKILAGFMDIFIYSIRNADIFSAFTSSDVTVLQRLGKVRVMSVK